MQFLERLSDHLDFQVLVWIDTPYNNSVTFPENAVIKYWDTQDPSSVPSTVTSIIIPLVLFDSLIIDSQYAEVLKQLKKFQDSDTNICQQISKLDQILTSSHNESINKKATQIGRMLENSYSLIDERGTNLHAHLERAAEYLERLNSFPKYISTTDLNSFGAFYYRECWKYLLHAQVELAYFLNEQLDPQIGWLHYEKSEQENPEWTSLTNPFFSIKFDTEKQGSVSHIEYLPRKILLLDSEPSHYFSLSPIADDCTSVYPHQNSFGEKSFESSSVPPSIVRRQLDLMALRFNEKLSLSEAVSTATVIKTIYLKSMLGSFMPNSTTGYSFEFWLEEYPEEIDDFYLNFHHIVLMPNQRDLISLRPLLPLAGEGQLSYLSEDVLTFKSNELTGGLSGLRLIEGSSHLVLDYRFAKTIEQLTVQTLCSPAYETKVHLVFTMKASSVLTFDQIQTMHFCIY